MRVAIPTSPADGDARLYENDGVVEIGRYCSIAHDVEFFLGGVHHPEWISTYPHHAHPQEVSSNGNISIGNDVSIGRGTSILSGVTIGDGAVVGANSLVTRDVRPYAVVGGVPAREIRLRFDESVVARLHELRWWDWPDHLVAEHAALLQQPDVRRFLSVAANVKTQFDVAEDQQG